MSVQILPSLQAPQPPLHTYAHKVFVPKITVLFPEIPAQNGLDTQAGETVTQREVQLLVEKQKNKNKKMEKSETRQGKGLL